MWGKLEPKIVQEPKIDITETKKAYTSVVLRYQVLCEGDNNKKETYEVKEFFKVLYKKDSFYLLEYDRTMEEIFDTSNVTNMTWMFYCCSSLSIVPLFDTSKVTRMDGVFWRCTNVQSGALAFYQQASSQANPPSQHSETFYNCGTNTTTGAAELAQIPDDWK
jgi:surface protein